MEAVIEAILFTMGESVELKKIAAAIEHDEATHKKDHSSVAGQIWQKDKAFVLLSWKTPFGCGTEWGDV